MRESHAAIQKMSNLPTQRSKVGSLGKRTVEKEQ
jgi:hypothetical protein